MRFSDEFLGELKSRCDITEIIGSYVDLRLRGATATGLCPFHNEKTPSFTVYVNTQSYYCFGCGMGGDVITFIKNIESLDYSEAVRLLADRAGMAMPADGYDDSVAKMRRRLLAANREAARFFYSNLSRPECRQALDYLTSRGLTAETIRRFGLGAAIDGWDFLLRHLKSKGYSESELISANLAVKTRNGNTIDAFRNRVMFPIIDVRGSVVAFGGRVLDDSKPKYINTSDTPVYKKSHGIFALNFAKQGTERTLILCEGYMDVIAYHSAGFTNAVACLGTALTSEQAKLLSKYADEVILSYDADDAGRTATKRAIRVLSSTPLRIRVASLSGGKDPDEIIKKHGRERMREILDGAVGDTQYDLTEKRARHNLSDTQGKLAYLSEAASVLAGVGDMIKRDVYASRLAEETGVSKQAVLAQVESLARSRRRREEKQHMSAQASFDDKAIDKVNPERRRNITAAKAEETLIASLLANPDFYGKIRDRLEDGDFATQLNLRLYKLIGSRLEEGRSVDVTALAQELSDGEAGYIVRLEAMRASLGNTVRECLDCIERMKSERKEREKKKPADMTDEEWLAEFKKP